MSEIKDKVKEKIASYLWMHRNNPITHDLEALRRASQILSIPGIAIVDGDAELPLFTKKDCITIDSWIMERMSRLKITGISNHQIAKLLEMFMDEQVYPAGYVKEVKE